MTIKKNRLSRKISKTSSTKFDGSHLNMLINVSTFALSTDNIATTSSVPAYKTSMLNIQSNLETIETVKGLARLALTGIADQKEGYKSALSLLIGNGMQAVYTYAVDTNNQELANQMCIAPSTLGKMTNTALLQLSSAVISTVSPLASSGVLTDYSVTTSSVTAWQAICDELRSILAAPKNAIANRLALNDAVDGLLHDNMFILTNKCDTLVRQITDANYLASYYSNRKLNEHHLSTQGRFHIANITGQPVTTGEVFIIGTNSSAELDNNGYALVDHIPFGKHAVTISAPWGDFTYGPFDFKKGKSLTLYFQLPETATGNLVVSVKEQDLAEADATTDSKAGK